MPAATGAWETGASAPGPLQAASIRPAASQGSARRHRRRDPLRTAGSLASGPFGVGRDLVVMGSYLYPADVRAAPRPAR
ncbi:hypothetical protein GCM10027089_34200 [Nocardia thraciensis]